MHCLSGILEVLLHGHTQLSSLRLAIGALPSPRRISQGLMTESALTSGRAGGGPRTVPVTMNEVLLRGCTIKNSGAVHGLVIYTGPESRIQMNAARPPKKTGEPCEAQRHPSCDGACDGHLRTHRVHV